MFLSSGNVRSRKSCEAGSSPVSLPHATPPTLTEKITVSLPRKNVTSQKSSKDVHTISNRVYFFCNTLIIHYWKNMFQFYSSFAAAWFAELCNGSCCKHTLQRASEARVRGTKADPERGRKRGLRGVVWHGEGYRRGGCKMPGIAEGQCRA